MPLTARFAGCRVFDGRTIHRVLLAIPAVAADRGATLVQAREPAVSGAVEVAILGAPRIGDLGVGRVGAREQPESADRQGGRYQAHVKSPRTPPTHKHHGRPGCSPRPAHASPASAVEFDAAIATTPRTINRAPARRAADRAS